MKIRRVQAHLLVNIPIQTPPFRKVPSQEDALLLEIETDDGMVGWAISSFAHEIMADFINKALAPELVGENPLLIEKILGRLSRQFIERRYGRVLIAALSAIDIALWDVKGKALGQPVHHLLGGARESIPIYVTHGAANKGAPRYSIEELAAEAKFLVEHGNRHLKNTVGRQTVPDPDDDYLRMKAMRDAVGPDVTLAMDGNTFMSVSQAVRLCKLTEELKIHFLEEPIYENDPLLLAELKKQTTIPIASAQNHRFSMRDLLLADAIDIVQPNVSNDGGYTGALRIAALARAFNKPLGHGNGNGPHNIALHAGLLNGAIVEYHFHRWMTYNAIFERVPQPENGMLEVSGEPGFGLNPKEGVVAEFAA